MNSEALILIGTLGGALIGALSSLMTTWLAKRSEEKRHYRQIIIDAAIESWKHTNEIVLARNRGNMRLQPLDDYIIHMIKFSELIIDGNINASNVEEKMRELKALSDKVHDLRIGLEDKTGS